jgi:hypothetical protein
VHTHTHTQAHTLINACRHCNTAVRHGCTCTPPVTFVGADAEVVVVGTAAAARSNVVVASGAVAVAGARSDVGGDVDMVMRWREADVIACQIETQHHYQYLRRIHTHTCMRTQHTIERIPEIRLTLAATKSRPDTTVHWRQW